MLWLGNVAKIAVLVSSVFNVIMAGLIATDAGDVIASPYGGGWWDVLQAGPLDEGDVVDKRAHIYPRIWASFLLFQLVVRANWVLTIEIAPALYRCVLVSYVLAFAQYCPECYYFETLPPLDWTMALFMTILPWALLIVGYSKYTKESASVMQSKKE
jgi:hypothetical protein